MPDKTGIKFYLLSSVMHPTFSSCMFITACSVHNVHNWARPRLTSYSKRLSDFVLGPGRAEPVTTLVAGFPQSG